MTHTDITGDQVRADTAKDGRARRRIWRGSLVETVAALRLRDPKAYEDWLDERDTIVIASVLSRLTDRQLGRIGLSRETLVLDIEDLKRISARNSTIAAEALELVAGDHAPVQRRDGLHPVAAE